MKIFIIHETLKT